ncbi:unnamed protein product [Trichogramma brassicae]|uniref:Uncharacterized protein n=1 Tax=Trichogramma brassicae TaxID=86971 RepID=A0A6H5J6E2_9HYME|nr:unnamed protein product [Trichogramma brassicae]
MPRGAVYTRARRAIDRQRHEQSAAVAAVVEEDSQQKHCARRRPSAGVDCNSQLCRLLSCASRSKPSLGTLTKKRATRKQQQPDHDWLSARPRKIQEHRESAIMMTRRRRLLRRRPPKISAVYATGNFVKTIGCELRSTMYYSACANTTMRELSSTYNLHARCYYIDCAYLLVYVDDRSTDHCIICRSRATIVCIRIGCDRVVLLTR